LYNTFSSVSSLSSKLLTFSVTLNGFGLHDTDDVPEVFLLDMVLDAVQLMKSTFTVKLHLRDGRKDEDASLRPSVRPSVRTFVSLSVFCQVRPSYGRNEPRCYIEI